MKKRLLVLAVMAMTVSLATADVVSKNVVGYYTVKLNTPGYSMIGINFNSIEGTGIPIQDLFLPSSLYPGEGLLDFDNCDQVIVWDNDTQNFSTYRYVDIGTGPAWYDEDFEVATLSLNPGAAFWFYRPSSNGEEEVKIVGQVDERQTIGRSFLPGYSMFSKSFPVEKLIGDEIEGYPGEGLLDFDNCDQLVIWNNNSQDFKTYYYVDIGEGPRWHDEGCEPVSEDFLVGMGAWYLYQGSGTLEWSENTPL